MARKIKKSSYGKVFNVASDLPEAKKGLYVCASVTDAYAFLYTYKLLPNGGRKIGSKTHMIARERFTHLVSTCAIQRHN